MVHSSEMLANVAESLVNLNIWANIPESLVNLDIRANNLETLLNKLEKG